MLTDGVAKCRFDRQDSVTIRRKADRCDLDSLIRVFTSRAIMDPAKLLVSRRVNHKLRMGCIKRLLSQRKLLAYETHKVALCFTVQASSGLIQQHNDRFI